MFRRHQLLQDIARYAIELPRLSFDTCVDRSEWIGATWVLHEVATWSEGTSWDTSFAIVH